jgi:hypothetical protein
MPYGGHDLGIDREKLALVIDDMMQDLAEARSASDLAGATFALDRVVWNLAVTLGIHSLDDMTAMPGFPENPDVLFSGDSDGYDDLRWMAAMVQRGATI